MKNVIERDGKKLHAGMIAAAEKAIAGKGDGRISEADAQQILTHLGNAPLEIRIATIEYILKTFKLTSSGERVLNPQHGLLPEQRPFSAYRGGNTPGVVLVNDTFYFVTRQLGSGDGRNVYSTRWEFLRKPPLLHDTVELYTYGFNGPSALYQPKNEDEDNSYIFTAFTTNSEDILVGRYNVDDASENQFNTLDYNKGTKRSQACGVVTCIPFGNTIYLGWRDKTTGNIKLGQLDYNNNNNLDARPVYTPLVEIEAEKDYYKNGPAIISCFRENAYKENEQYIMIYYTSPNSATGNSNFNVAAYNPTTPRAPIHPTSYELDRKMENEITVRKLTSSKMQVVCIDGSKSLDVVEIEHGEAPDYKQYVIDDLNVSFTENGQCTFQRVGMGHYLFYFDKNSNMNYYLMPNTPIT